MSILASKPTGEWNTFEIHAVGRNIMVILNGATVPHLTEMAAGRFKGKPGYKTISAIRWSSFGIYGLLNYRRAIPSSREKRSIIKEQELAV